MGGSNLIFHFYLSPYLNDGDYDNDNDYDYDYDYDYNYDYNYDYDYDSWHGFSRYVFSNIYEQEFEPLMRMRNGSQVQYNQLTFFSSPNEVTT
jgi:hypothetical protein